MINIKNTYKVQGMTCDDCVQTIKTKLELENEITEVNISLSESKLTVISNKNYEPEDLNKIIKNVGNYYIENNKSNKYKQGNLIDYIKTYKPILLALFFVVLLAVISSIERSFSYKEFFRLYMGYFFIIFSFFKTSKYKTVCPVFFKI